MSRSVEWLLPCHIVWRDAWWAPFASVAVVLLSQYVSVWSLLDMSRRGRLSRRSLLLLGSFFWCDITFNRQVTFGSRLRDTALGTLSWNLLARSLSVGLVYDLDDEDAPPRWIVPDWKAEAKPEGDASSTASNGKAASESTPSETPLVRKWRRKTLARRPSWAKITNTIPRHWRTLDYPTSVADQALWALDVWLIRRHGTSWMLKEEMRALEWSKSKLERAGQAQYDARRTGKRLQTSFDERMQPFGYVETTLWSAIVDTALMLTCFHYMTNYRIPMSSYADYYAAPFKHQLMLVMCVGTMIGLSTTVVEFFLVPLVQRWPLQMPATAIIPTYRDVRQSQTLTQLWAWRWHSMSKRDFVALSRLLPFGGGGKGNKVALLFKVFFWSGVMHSMIGQAFTRPSLNDPLEIVKIFVSPGPMAFFLSQAVLILIEQAASPFLVRAFGDLHGNNVPRCWKSTLFFALRNLWVWTALLFTGQWLAAELASYDVLTPEQVRSMRPFVQLCEFKDFFSRHLFGTPS